MNTEPFNYIWKYKILNIDQTNTKPPSGLISVQILKIVFPIITSFYISSYIFPIYNLKH